MSVRCLGITSYHQRGRNPARASDYACLCIQTGAVSCPQGILAAHSSRFKQTSVQTLSEENGCGLNQLLAISIY